MSHDARQDTSAPDTEANPLEATVRQLILMRETGPKSAAWHRARVQMIWRLQRTIDESQRPQLSPHESLHTPNDGDSTA